MIRKRFQPTVFPHVGTATIDDAVYYHSIHTYGKQDPRVAIEASTEVRMRFRFLARGETDSSRDSLATHITPDTREGASRDSNFGDGSLDLLRCKISKRAPRADGKPRQ